MISSTSNARIKTLKKLMASAKLRRERSCFVVEGPRMFFEIPRERILECYVTDEFAAEYEEALRGYVYETVEGHVMKSLSDTKTPQGVLAVVGRHDTGLETLLADQGAKKCFLILESLQDPGNLGTILRTAEAAGVTGVILDRCSVDPYNMKVVRSTMGSIFRMPLLIAEDLEEVCARMKNAGVTVFACDLEGEAIYHTDFSGDCAFLIGNEGNGLSREILGKADRRIRIPMKGKVESLNAAMASAVMVYEVLRQREWQV